MPTCRRERPRGAAVLLVADAMNLSRPFDARVELILQPARLDQNLVHVLNASFRKQRPQTEFHAPLQRFAPEFRVIPCSPAAIGMLGFHSIHVPFCVYRRLRLLSNITVSNATGKEESKRRQLTSIGRCSLCPSVPPGSSRHSVRNGSSVPRACADRVNMCCKTKFRPCT